MLENRLRSDIWFNLGQAYAQMGTKVTRLQAIEYYLKCVELQSKDTNADYAPVRHKTLFNLGIAYRRNKEALQSIIYFKKAQDCQGVAKAATANNLGLSLFDAEEFEEAQNEFEKAIKFEEEALEGEKGKDNLEDIAFYHNNSGLCWYHLARQDKPEGPILENAVDQYNMAIKADDRNPIHYFNRGNVHLCLM